MDDVITTELTCVVKGCMLSMCRVTCVYSDHVVRYNYMIGTEVELIHIADVIRINARWCDILCG